MSHQQNGPSTSSASNGSSSAVHSCEICGQSGLSDEKMLEHTQKCHVEGNGSCPFCGLTDASSAELLLHVNQAHLDYLTPENELMSFIDDSKSADGDSDSMSCGLSPSITEIPGIISGIFCSDHGATKSHQNGATKTVQNGGTHHATPTTATTTKIKQPYTGTSTKLTNGGSVANGSLNGSKAEPVIFNYSNAMDDNNNTNNNVNCDNENVNGGAVANGVHHGEGSPLRSQLGLKLKVNNKSKITIPLPSSTLMCLMCPYTTGRLCELVLINFSTKNNFSCRGSANARRTHQSIAFRSDQPRRYQFWCSRRNIESRRHHGRVCLPALCSVLRDEQRSGDARQSRAPRYPFAG